MQGPGQAPPDPGPAPWAHDARLAAAVRLAPLLQGARAAEGPNPCPDPGSHPARGAGSNLGGARGQHAGEGGEPNPKLKPALPPPRAHRSLPEVGSPGSPRTPQLGARGSADCAVPAAGAGKALGSGPSSASTRSVQGTAPWRSSSIVEATPVLASDARCPVHAKCVPEPHHRTPFLHSRWNTCSCCLSIIVCLIAAQELRYGWPAADIAELTAHPDFRCCLQQCGRTLFA